MAILRVAILYQRGYFYYIPPSEGTHQLDGENLSIRHFSYTLTPESKRQALDAAETFDPQIAIIYRPDYVPIAGRLPGAYRLGVSTEIFPRLYQGVLHCEDKDLKCLGELLSADLQGYHSILHHDAYSINLINQSLKIPTAFHPLTLSDSLYANQPQQPADKEYDVVFVGHINQRRQKFLGEIKSHFSCLCIDSGVSSLEQLRRISALGRINLNLHANYGITREIRVPLLLQLGQTVLSEALYADELYRHPDKLSFDIETIGDCVSNCLTALSERTSLCQQNWRAVSPLWTSQTLLSTALEQLRAQRSQQATSEPQLTDIGQRLKLSIGIRDFYTAKNLVQSCLR